MTPKVTLSISEDLATRLEPRRDQLNLSRIFAEAVERELIKQVQLPEDAQQIADLLSRLKDEKDTTEAEDYATGKRDGLDYATSAGYSEFRKFERIDAELRGDAKPRGFRYEDDDFQLPDYANEGLDQLITDESVLDDRLYRQGWLDGMMTVWKEVSGKI